MDKTQEEKENINLTIEKIKIIEEKAKSLAKKNRKFSLIFRRNRRDYNSY